MDQVELARKFGIYGFCYCHYLFKEKRLLNMPVDRMLQNKDEDFPYMLRWSMKNGVGDGMDKKKKFYNKIIF